MLNTHIILYIHDDNISKIDVKKILMAILELIRYHFYLLILINISLGAGVSSTISNPTDLHWLIIIYLCVYSADAS